MGQDWEVKGNRMAICDLCGARCSASDLEQLRDAYQVPGVVDICPSCSRWASKVKGDMISEIAPRMRKVIAERKGVTPRKWYWPFAALKEQK